MKINSLHGYRVGGNSYLRENNPLLNAYIIYCMFFLVNFFAIIWKNKDSSITKNKAIKLSGRLKWMQY